MTEHTPYIGFENLPAPSQGFLVTPLHHLYEEWSAHGAEFMRPPVDRGAEIRGNRAGAGAPCLQDRC